jgi:UDP-glucose 4-epimerase
MGAPSHPIAHLDARNEVHIAYSDHSKALRSFGRYATTSLDAGLKRMAVWARSAGSRTGRPFEAVEVLRNLPPSWRRFVRS